MFNIQMNQGFTSLNQHARRYDSEMISNVKKMKTFSYNLFFMIMILIHNCSI